MGVVTLRSFVFGKDFSPRWFLMLYERGTVKWDMVGGKVIGCSYTNIDGVEIHKKFGEIISNQEFFKDARN